METNPEIYEAKYLQETETDGKKVVTVTVKHFKKVVAVQDNDAHWYIIDAKDQEEFNNLLEMAGNYDKPAEQEQAELEFENKFSHYRTGGDLNNVQLYSEI